jgi:hypothetical protein
MPRDSAIKASRMLTLSLATITGLVLLVSVAVTDVSVFDKPEPAAQRSVILRDLSIQGIGSRVLIPANELVIRPGEKVLISYSGQNLDNTVSEGSISGLVSTVIPGLGFWVRFPQFDVVNGAYPPSPVPAKVSVLTVEVQF